jgi:calcineurin-like phosphoesterase family protein
MSKIWISSDFHFSHVNITGPKVSTWKSGYRNFDTTHDMNCVIHNAINEYVKEDDILYFLGDFSFGGESKVPIHRNLINCKTIHFILGNHDQNIKKYTGSFSSIQDELRIEFNGCKIWMRHYPEPGYSGKRTDQYLMYGHIHSNESQMPGGLSMDVGIDNAYKLVGKYRPFELSEAINIISSKNIN